MINGKNIFLRPVKTSDIPWIMKWENNPENWLVSETEKPYSFEEINLLIESSEDIFENGQLRFILVDNSSGYLLGTMDLFKANFEEKTVHVGILIAEEKDRRKGYAEEAVQLVQDYVFQELKMVTIYSTIQFHNQPSIQLFKKCGFEVVADEKENPIFDSNSNETIKMCLCLKK
jgi:diamine N-acetyltransferase